MKLREYLTEQKVVVKKVKKAQVRPEWTSDRMYRTSFNQTAIWGVFVDGKEIVRIMGRGGDWHFVEPKKFRIVSKRTYFSKKDATDAAIKYALEITKK